MSRSNRKQRSAKILFATDKIAACISAHEDIVTAFIYGSFAKGQARPESDMDVAILLSAGVQWALKARLNMISQLEEIAGRDVQLLVLNTADPIIKHQVFKYGQLILQKNKNFYQAFWVKSLNEYFDLKQVRKPIEQSLGAKRIYG